MSFRWLFLVASFVLVFASLTPAQSSDDQRLDKLRERFERLTPEQQTRLRERFREFEQSSPDRRRELERRAKELKQREGRLGRHREFQRWAKERGLPLDPRKLDRKEKRSWLESRKQRREEQRRKTHELLPERLRSELEGHRHGTPEHRRWMELNGGRLREARFLAEARENLQLSKKEARSILELPDVEREARLTKLHRRLIEQGVERHGLGKVDSRRWSELQALDDDREFLERVRRLRLPIRDMRIPHPPRAHRGRRDGPGHGGREGAGPPRGPRGGEGPPHRGSGERGRRGGDGPPERGERGGRRGHGDGEGRRAPRDRQGSDGGFFPGR